MHHCVAGFCSERPDPVSGVTHSGCGYRAYYPGLMRFSCPDSMSPFGAGGINPCAYCVGDPVNRADPDGHHSLPGWVGIAAGITLGVLFTPVSGGSSLAVALSVLSVTTAVASAGLAIAQQFVEGSDPGAARILGWAALGSGIISGLSLVALSRVASGAKSLSSLLTGGASRPFRGLMLGQADSGGASRSTPFDYTEYFENKNNFTHEITPEGDITSQKLKEIKYSERLNNAGTQFANRYEPEQWTLSYNYRNENEPFFTNQMIRYQYERVSGALHFKGQYPARILWQDVANKLTLKNTLSREGADLFDAFFNMTPLGRTTRYILDDFNLRATQVTHEINANDPDSMDILVRVRPA